MYIAAVAYFRLQLDLLKERIVKGKDAKLRSWDVHLLVKSLASLYFTKLGVAITDLHSVHYHDVRLVHNAALG